MVAKRKNLPIYLQGEPDGFPPQVPPFLDHMFMKIDKTLEKGLRVLVLTLTKKSSEDVTNFLLGKGYKTFYLHSEVDTIDRWEILTKLKKGDIDILVGVNLLREGIDLPEVGFIALLDADKEGFLRSTTALVQNIGRAARNPHSEVALYADRFTKSMTKALYETYRRRSIQDSFNKKNNITPTKATSNVKDLGVVKSDETLEKMQQYKMIKSGKVKKLKKMTKKEKQLILKDLKAQLDESIKNREFEEAAVLRDQIKGMEEM